MVQSTKEFVENKDPDLFKSRYSYDDLHDCGLCRHMILKNNSDSKIEINELTERKHLNMTCPLHPFENHGKEYRIGECDPSFMCETQKMFLQEWGEWTKKRFLSFVESKDLDWFSYSKGMHNNSIVKEFFDSGFVANYFK